MNIINTLNSFFNQKNTQNFSDNIKSQELESKLSTIETQQYNNIFENLPYFLEQIELINSRESLYKFKNDFSHYIIHCIEENNISKSNNLKKEFIYFFKYLFILIETDYFIGNNVINYNISNIDLLIYEAEDIPSFFKNQINEFTKLEKTQRFFENEGKKNLLGYFVFLEEHGLNFNSVLLKYKKLLSKYDKNTWFL